MPKSKKSPALPALLCMMAVMLGPVVLSSCNGNSGGYDYEGPTYTPGSSSGSSDIDAAEMLNLSNAGDIEGIIARLTGGSSGSSTASPSTVILKASEIGLPSGGTATLTITGNGVDYTATATADADGNITFEIPAITAGTEITASLTIKNASGTALYAGSSTQTVSGDNFQMDIRLTRQFWTLPASLTVTASPDGLVYDSENMTASTTFSISGLDDAPAGAVFNYEWTDESGASVGSGATLTRTLSELLDGTPPTGDVTKTFSVTVSYTDESGSTVTSSGAASVIVGGPVTLPSFSVDFTAPASINSLLSDPTKWALTSMSDTLSLTATPDSGSFPAGTTFEWHVNGSLVSQTGATCTLSPSSLFSSTSTTTGTPASPYTMTVTCTAKNSRATGDKLGTGGSRQLFYVVSLPDFVISINKPSTATGSASPYKLADLTSSFTLTAMGATFPAGTTFEWKVNGTTLSGSGTSTTFSPGGVGFSEDSIGHTAGAATSFNITCTAKNPHAAADLPRSAMVGAYLPYSMPSSFTISISPPASASTDANGAYALANLTDSFTITASGTFPPGTTFLWTLGSTHLEEDGTYTYSLTPAQIGITAETPGSAASPIESQILGCRAKNDDAYPTFRIGNNPTIKAYYALPLDAPTGISISSIDGGTAPSSSSGAWRVDTTTNMTPIGDRNITLISTGSYPVLVKYVWTVNGTEVETTDSTITKTWDEFGVTINPMSGTAILSVSCSVKPANSGSGYLQSDPKSQAFGILFN